MKNALYKSTALSAVVLVAAGCLALAQPAMAQLTCIPSNANTGTLNSTSAYVQAQSAPDGPNGNGSIGPCVQLTLTEDSYYNIGTCTDVTSETVCQYNNCVGQVNAFDAAATSFAGNSAETITPQQAGCCALQGAKCGAPPPIDTQCTVPLLNNSTAYLYNQGPYAGGMIPSYDSYIIGTLDDRVEATTNPDVADVAQTYINVYNTATGVEDSKLGSVNFWNMTFGCNNLLPAMESEDTSLAKEYSLQFPPGCLDYTQTTNQGCPYGNGGPASGSGGSTSGR